MNPEDLTVIVVTHNSMNVLPGFLDSIQEGLSGIPCPILVCDNGSKDCIEAYLKTQPGNIKLLKSDCNEGFGAGLNRGILEASTPFIALMNPDIQIEKDGFHHLVKFLIERPNAGGVSGPVLHVSPKENLPNARALLQKNKMAVHFGYYNLISRILYYSGVGTKFRRHKAFYQWTHITPRDSVEVTRLNGSFGVFRKKAIVEAGYYDPRLFLYFEEDDIAIRLKLKGHKLFVTDRTVILHTSGKGSDLSSDRIVDKVLLNSQYIFFKKHYGAFYAWSSFFCIWGVLCAVYLHQRSFKRHGAMKVYDLCRWHFESLVKGGGLPEGTIPDGGKNGVDYVWSN